MARIEDWWPTVPSAIDASFDAMVMALIKFNPSWREWKDRNHVEGARVFYRKAFERGDIDENLRAVKKAKIEVKGVLNP